MDSSIPKLDYVSLFETRRGPGSNSEFYLLQRTKKFAVIEDEPLIGMEITSTLQEGGAQVFGPVAAVSDALRIIEESELDGALVDANLRGEPTDDIAAALTRKKIPFMFVTGYGREALPASFAQARILKKPFVERELVEAAALLVEQPPSVRRLRD